MPIGPGIPAAQVAGGLGAAMVAMPGDPRWTFVEADKRPFGVFVTLFNGVVHSGYFRAHVDSDGWHDHERAEQQHRLEHERVMGQLFGADSYDGEALIVDLVRDPRSGLEQIRFQVK